ncbi:hypothetical protein BDZ89DRAFT_1159628 [Hymenopellis radicata]|nr:hypothetical protein BDZ89DRAFT_1159628 [Hymenopellis radicata]
MDDDVGSSASTSGVSRKRNYTQRKARDPTNLSWREPIVDNKPPKQNRVYKKPRKTDEEKRKEAEEKKKADEAAKREEQERKDKEEARRNLEMAAKLLGKLLGVDDIYLHEVKHDEELVQRIVQAEQQVGHSLDHDHPVLQDVQWFSKPGIHFGLNDESDVVFAIRIVPPGQITMNQQRVIELIMEWCDVVQEIKNNGSMHRSGKGATRMDMPSSGKQYGMGWHGSMEKGKSAAFYAPRKGQEILYNTLLKQLPFIASKYEEAMATLVPGVFQTFKAVAENLELPAFFNSGWQGQPDQYSGANSMTITHSGFSNYLHQDNDFCEIAYGWWWTSKRQNGHYTLDEKVNHTDVKGGGFLWGGFGCGVDFERTTGLVEIFWRGSFDHHVTLKSYEPEYATRWGTSIQITKKGVHATQKVYAQEPGLRVDRVKRPTDYFDDRGLSL